MLPNPLEVPVMRMTWFMMVSETVAAALGRWPTR